MRPFPQSLQDHLTSGATTTCWCWRLILRDGTVLGFTDHDRDLEFDNTRFEAASGFSASEMENTLGLGVDNMDVSGALQSDRLTEADLFAGRYDNAKAEVWLVNWQDVNQRALLKTGSLGEVRRSKHGFSCEIRGLSHFLNQPAGRKFQFGCDADLGDHRCRVDLTSPDFSAQGGISNNDGNRVLVVTGLESYPDGWFSRGQLTWLSGENAGLSEDVKTHSLKEAQVSIELWQAMTATVSQGDQFRITAGCDKQFATCRDKFANAVNFRGFPHMPGNDFMTSYPNRDDVSNDGSSRSTTSRG